MDRDKILSRIRKPGRYLGTEVNSIHKKKSEVKVHLALAFPDLYEVAMSHLGLKILYGLANELPGVYAERVFATAGDLENILRSKKIPLFSLESRTPLKEFDLVGFTLQYELSYTTILNMLHLGGIPLKSRERKGTDPFIMGGGPGAFNAEPLAPFFDFFVLGDGEEVLVEIIREYSRWKEKGGKDRQSFLEAAAAIPGVYVPSFYEPAYAGESFAGIETVRSGVPGIVEKRVIQDLENSYYPVSFIVPFVEIVHDRAVLELYRGCSHGCRFCQAGMIYRPVRRRSVSRLRELGREIINRTGYEELSLASLSSSDYPEIEELIAGLEEDFRENYVKLSLPSLRACPFAVEITNRLQKGKSGGITFAPEAGSQRLRDVINKKVTEEDILKAAELAVASGRNQVKLYFMMGLPTEREEDLLEMVELVKKISGLKGRKGGKGSRFKVTVSVSTFVPKAHSPFQWESQLEMGEIKRRQEFLRRHFRKLKKVDFTWHDAEMSFLEAVFSRGDRRLAAVLERAWALGCRMDAWSDSFNFPLWQQAFQEEGIDPEYFSGYKPGYGDPLPWDHISTGVKKEFLIREHQRALAEETTGDCRERCSGCGLPVCPTRQEVCDASF